MRNILLRNVYSTFTGEYERNCHFLYTLLSQRERHQNISHEEMPTYKQHCKFVDNHHYRTWHLIQDVDVIPNTVVGSLYVTKHNEIGLFILKSYVGQGYGTAALNKLLAFENERPIYANINPENYKSIEFFKQHGFKKNTTYADRIEKPFQVTYVLNGLGR